MALHMNFRLMAAMFDLPVTLTSESMHTSITELLDCEHVGVAFGISLLSTIEAEILRFFYELPVIAAILDLPLTPMSESIYNRLS